MANRRLVCPLEHVVVAAQNQEMSDLSDVDLMAAVARDLAD